MGSLAPMGLVNCFSCFFSLWRIRKRERDYSCGRQIYNSVLAYEISGLVRSPFIFGVCVCCCCNSGVIGYSGGL